MLATGKESVVEEVKRDETGCLPRKKRYTAEKNECARLLLKMKQQQILIEKCLNSFMENVKVDRQIIQDVLHDRSELSTKRQKLLEGLSKSLDEIGNEMKSVKSIITNPEEIQTLDVDSYKSKLLSLTNKIQDLKKSSPLQALAEEQLQLDAELKEFSSNLEKYNVSINNGTERCVYFKSNESIASMQNWQCDDAEQKKPCHYKEIKDFHKLIGKTGHTENWSDEDHQFFLKTRKKCSTIPALVAAVQSKCPDLSAETIVNHEAWYKIYLDLRDKQKARLKEWRVRKELERATKPEDNERIGVRDPKESKARVAISAGNRVVPSGVERPESAPVSIDAGNDERSAVDKKRESIQQWRADRERKRRMDEEQLKRQLELRRASEDKRRRDRLNKAQEALREYRRRKALEDPSIGADETATRCKFDPALIKAFRLQDERYVKKKKDSTSRVTESNESRASKPLLAKPSKVRADTTLFNPTKVWTEKCKLEDLTPRQPQGVQYIKDIPSLCVRWRNEESLDLRNA